MSKEQTPVSSGELKAEELMLGNWINNGGYNVQVNLGLLFDISAGFMPEVYSGIPLAPEILEKCGFVKDSKGDYWKDLQTHYLLFNESSDGFYPQYAGLPEMSSESEQIVSLHRINYVHELQNLYKILTGTHLTINL